MSMSPVASSHEQPAIYVLEGVDAVGMTTICRLLAEMRGWEYHSTPAGPFALEFGRFAEHRDPWANYYLYLASILYTSRRLQIRSAVAICDRYFQTLAAYSAARGSS